MFIELPDRRGEARLCSSCMTSGCDAPVITTNQRERERWYKHQTGSREVAVSEETQEFPLVKTLSFQWQVVQ